MALADGLLVFKALADETRLQILALLSARGTEACGCQLLHDLDCAQPTLSYHLRCLQDAGLITARRDGCQVYYRVNAGLLNSALALAALAQCQTADMDGLLGER